MPAVRIGAVNYLNAKPLIHGLQQLAPQARLVVAQEVEREEGLELKQLQIKGVRELFFSKGERDAWLFPQELQAEMTGDERHAGRSKCTLRFTLPRGAYATMVVKRILG